MFKSFIALHRFIPIIALLLIGYGLLHRPSTPPQKANTLTQERKPIYTFFAYSCSQCKAFYPYLRNLAAQLPSQYQLEPIPIVKNEHMRLEAHMHYAAKQLNILNQIEADAYFQGAVLSSKEDMVQFLVKTSRGKLTQYIVQTTFDSNEVSREVEKASRLYSKFNIHKYPALVVDGKLIDPETGDFKEMVDTTLKATWQVDGRQ